MEKKQKFSDILVIGGALFAMFFGAGNLIFPPLLGQQSGTSWFIGFLFFFIFDVGLALVAILALVRKGQFEINGITDVMGKVPSTIINCIAVLCIGPLLAIPRTAATTFEIGVQPLAPNFSTWIFSAIFFAIVLALTIRPSKVVDIIGSFLTPVLVITLLVMIIKGIISPLGPIDVPETTNSVQNGTLNGYQTLDVLASMIFIMIITSSAQGKGYTEGRSLSKAVLRSSCVASIGLFVIYGGLTYLGATTCNLADMQGLNQTALLVAITKALFGNTGVILLGVIVLFACLTTAIGLSSSTGAFFEELTGGKVSYKKVVIIVVVFSWLISNAGVSTIIQFSAPLLNLVYPGVLVLIILAFFHKSIKNKNIYRVATYFAIIVSALEILAGFGLPTGFVKSLPLASIGFAWIVPAIVGGIIGKFIPCKD